MAQRQRDNPGSAVHSGRREAPGVDEAGWMTMVDTGQRREKRSCKVQPAAIEIREKLRRRKVNPHSRAEWHSLQVTGPHAAIVKLRYLALFGDCFAHGVGRSMKARSTGVARRAISAAHVVRARNRRACLSRVPQPTPCLRSV
ncbi:hypothetical protein VTO73DRAFT_6158 [Trametes versicolor]